MINLRKIFFAAAMFFLAGCAPGLDETLGVSSIGVPDAAEVAAGWDSNVTVSVKPFTDERGKDAIAEINGRTIQPASSVGNSVQAALERFLKEREVTVKLFDAPALGGIVRDWFVSVRPSFPTSRAESTATVEVQLFATDGQMVYRGKYTGQSAIEHPMLTESKIEEILGLAMGRALEQALKDENLLSKVSGMSHQRVG